MLDLITPLILTYNEEPNIERTLKQLYWAKDIVLVDSFSADRTLEIVSRYPQVRVFQRRFDAHEKQWNFGLKETGISSDWILALDADYVLTDDFIQELKAMSSDPDVSGYLIRFIYCVNGNPLRASLYPSLTVLFRKEKSSYIQDGHTQRLIVTGRTLNLRSCIMHDDRKTLRRWIFEQDRYQRLNAAKILAAPWKKRTTMDRLRSFYVLVPFMIFFYSLFGKGLILEGAAGFYYSLQKMFVECLLALHLIRRQLGFSEKNR